MHVERKARNLKPDNSVPSLDGSDVILPTGEHLAVVHEVEEVANQRRVNASESHEQIPSGDGRLTNTQHAVLSEGSALVVVASQV